MGQSCISVEDNLHEMSKPVFGENILKCRLLKYLPRVLAVDKTNIINYRRHANSDTHELHSEVVLDCMKEKCITV